MTLPELANEYYEDGEIAKALFCHLLACIIAISVLLLKYWIFWTVGKTILGF